MAWDDELRDGQAQAAGVDRGNYLLLAGPGTGKTFVLVRRIQYLVENLGVPPGAITALTFTRAAAAEMKERLDARFQAFRVQVSTLHSFALRELIMQGAAQVQRPVRVVDDYEERRVIIEELARLTNQGIPDIKELLGRLADDWDTLAIDGHGWQDGFPDPNFIAAWQRHREVYRYTLRSELVYQLLQELRENPEFAPSRGITALLIDEYQDLNRCDLSAIRMLSERTGAEVYAAGDDDQSIYSFRHAHPRGIREFGTEYPMSDQLVMMECLRCGPEIVGVGGWLIEQDHDRIPKHLESVTAHNAEVTFLRFDEQHDEARGLADIVAATIASGCPPEEILILLRSDPDQRTSLFLAEEFERNGIQTYRPRALAEGPGDLQRLREYLILSQSLRLGATDPLALRVLLELEQNGIGASRIRAVLEHALDWRVDFAGAMGVLRNNPNLYSKTGIDRLLTAVDEIIDRAESFQPVAQEDFLGWVDRVANMLGLSAEAQALVDDAGEVVVRSFEDTPGAIEAAPISYVQELTAALAGLADTRPTHIDGQVTITSMHGAKGLSADVVFVLQAEDEIIPGEAAGVEYEEARRLLYVSLTRARRRLFIGACLQRVDNQEWVRNRRIRRRTLTRFLEGYGLTAISSDQYLAGNS